MTGHLWLNGVEVDTVDTTFTVTVTEATTATDDDASEAAAGSSTGSTENACSSIGFKPVTKKEGFPKFELASVVDPKTGQSVKYTVSIPTKIQGIFQYDESDLLIYSTVDTSEAGFSGLFTITVKGTCDGVE